jgi:hypothetical protein
MRKEKQGANRSRFVAASTAESDTVDTAPITDGQEIAASDKVIALKYAKHDKLLLRKHTIFNEKWLHDRIADDPSILGLGEVRVLDRERAIQGGGRLDLLLLDEDNNRRYEVEIQLGSTDPSHIIRCIEYWDVERRRYPGYEHVAILIAENITTRFLNVISLLTGSIPIIAIQLDALSFQNHLLLNFTQVLDQTELRIDDTEEVDEGGGQADRSYWEKRAGTALMTICDQVLQTIVDHSRSPQELNYLRGYMGLRSSGVVNNFIHMSPKPTKRLVHIYCRNSNASEWKIRLDQSGIPAGAKREGRLRISVTPEEFANKRELIREIVADTVKEFEA